MHLHKPSFIILVSHKQRYGLLQVSSGSIVTCNTLDVYSHLFPSRKKAIGDFIDKICKFVLNRILKQVRIIGAQQIGANDGNRTCTGRPTDLSQARLPVPPFARMVRRRESNLQPIDYKSVYQLSHVSMYVLECTNGGY